MTGANVARGAACECCGATGDVYVDEVLYCARCALDKHFDALQGRPTRHDRMVVPCAEHDGGSGGEHESHG